MFGNEKIFSIFAKEIRNDMKNNYNYRILDINGRIKFTGTDSSKFGLGSWFNLEQARELRIDGDSIYQYDEDGNQLWETF